MKLFPIISIWLMALICGGIITIVILQWKRTKIINTVMRLSIIVLLFAVNLRPMISSGNAYTASNNLDVLFAIDTTISMIAEDYNGGSRLDAVKADVKYIVDQLNGARFSIISFNDRTRVVTPFTKDGNLVAEAAGILNVPDEYYAKGSSLNIALDEIINSFERASSDERVCVLFFISDGEITNDDTLKSFSSVKKYVKGGAVLGYGTLTGGKMLIADRYTLESEYLKDRSDWPYKTAVSVIDERNLQAIADDIGVQYVHMTQQSQVKNVLSEVKKMMEQDNSGNQKTAYEDIYFWFVIPLLMLFVFEFIGYKRNLL